MKILLVKTAVQKETIGLKNVMLVEPLELEMIGAVIPQDHEVLLVDCIIEKKPLMHFVRTFKPDLICFTAYITDVNTIKQECRLIKAWNRTVLTLAGGVHCEVCPQDLFDEEIDYRFVRNALTSFPLFLEFLQGRRTGLPEGVWSNENQVSLKALPDWDFAYVRPNRLLTKRYRKKYFYIFHDKIALLKTSFGCPYHCSFCFCKVITGGQYIQRDLNDVTDEIMDILENDIYIVDDDFLTSRTRARRFLDLLTQKKIKKSYLIYCRADFIATNPDIMQEFRVLGLKTVIVGFESFSDTDLDLYNKASSGNLNEEAIGVLNRTGIECFATMIVPPHWSAEDFKANAKKLVELKIHYVNLQPLTPLPGTEMENTEVILDRMEYEKWDLAHVSVQPQKMGLSEFYSHIIKMYEKVLFQPGTLLRYLRTYSPLMLLKMFVGSFRVKQDYLRKKREAQKDA